MGRVFSGLYCCPDPNCLKTQTTTAPAPAKARTRAARGITIDAQELRVTAAAELSGRSAELVTVDAGRARYGESFSGWVLTVDASLQYSVHGRHRSQ